VILIRRVAPLYFAQWRKQSLHNFMCS